MADDTNEQEIPQAETDTATAPEPVAVGEEHMTEGDDGTLLEILGQDADPAGEEDPSADAGDDATDDSAAEAGTGDADPGAETLIADTTGTTNEAAATFASVTIRSRASWGARYPNGDLTLSGLAYEVFAHHTVTTQLPADASVAQEEAQMRSLESIGQSRFGTGISYNVIIFPSGRAYQGVSWNRRGTHTGGRNSTSRSICFAGNYEAYRPTQAQISTAAAIYNHGRGRWWTRSAPLRGHREVSQTACPGQFVYARLSDIRGGGGSVAPGRLSLDGYWGSGTTTRLQQVLKTPVDGVVSSQSVAWRDRNPGLTTGWQWVSDPQGSPMIRALQARIGMASDDRDGKIGPQTIRALQRHLGTPVDGVISRRSQAVIALQRRLNNGRV